MSEIAYVYRRFPLDHAGLQVLLADVFMTDTVWSFASNSVKLLPIEHSAASEVKITGDKGDYDDGHVFNARAEVRWKRRDGRYDALILSETQIAVLAHERISDSTPPSVDSPVLHIRRYPHDTSVAVLLATPEEAQQRGKQWKLGYIEYVAPNGAVQFVRYTDLREERANELP